MPFYEYQCRKCGLQFEELLTVSERDREEKKLTCPSCGAGAPRRMISTFATSAGTSSAPTMNPACGQGG